MESLNRFGQIILRHSLDDTSNLREQCFTVEKELETQTIVGYKTLKLNYVSFKSV